MGSGEPEEGALSWRWGTYMLVPDPECDRVSVLPSVKWEQGPRQLTWEQT